MKTATPYAEALALAGELRARLAPACARIEIAGSLRRQSATVGDIELVAIPRVTFDVNLFGEPVGEPQSAVDAALADIVGPPDSWRWSKNGPAYKQFMYGPLEVDLFLVHPETWGVQFTLRTGNQYFSHWLVTEGQAGGALPYGLKVANGRLWNQAAGQPLETPEEADFFARIGLTFIPPTSPLRAVRDWQPLRAFLACPPERRNPYAAS